MRSLLCAVGLLAASLSAQSPLTTTYAGGNGLGAGANVYFDLTVNVPILVSQLDVNILSGAGLAGTVQFYTVPTTWVGNDSNAAAWTLQGTATIASSSASGTPTAAPLAAAFTLTPGTYGVAISYAGAIGPSYTNGNGANQNFSNAELSMVCGASGGVFTGAVNNPRVWNGSIYYTQAGSGTAATRTPYGTGCYAQFTSFYENFATSAAFDLANTSITMLPAAGGYTVLPGITTYVAPSIAATPLALTDDSETSVTLSSPFPHSAGVTTSLTVCSNGYVSIASGNGTGFTPTITTMLAGSQTGWWAWHDYNPAAVGSGQVKFEQVGAVAYLTWDGVFDFGGTTVASANTFQFQFDTSTGAVHIVFQTMSIAGNGRLVGYSPGGASNDPGNRDLSATLAGSFNTSGSDNLPLALTSSGRPITGTSINLVTNNIPVGTVLGATVVGTAQINPGLDLSFLGMPGCFQYTNPSTSLVFFVAGSSASVPFNIPNVAAFVGLHVYAQSATFSSGFNTFGVVSSNGLDLGIGNL